MYARAIITLSWVAVVAGLSAQYPAPFSGALPWSDQVEWNPLWSTAPPSVTTVLSDTLSVRFRGSKPMNLNIFFERRRIIRYASAADAARYGTVVLPESLDPPYDRRGRAWGEWTGDEGPDWCDVRVDAFAARRITPHGQWNELAFIAKLRTDTARSLRGQDVITRYRYELQGVEPGDVVELYWKYSVPYDLNWPNSAVWQHELAGNWQRLTSWRIFFHGDLPVQQQFVEILHHSRQGLYVAGERPAMMEEDVNDMRRVWVHYDLPGAMAEVNARSGTELPHLILQLDLYDHRNYFRGWLSNASLPTPYWANVLRWRERRVDWWRRVAAKGSPDRQNRLLQDFITRYAGAIPPGDRIGRMQALHNEMALNFQVAHDDLWYAGIDQRLDKFGDQVTDGVMRERSRYDLYAKLAFGVDLYYRTAYLLDNRVGALSPAFLTPLWEAPFAFVVGETAEELLLVPPDRNLNLMAGELPFYWSGSRALMCQIDLFWRMVAPVPIFMDLPEGERADLRRIELRVKVDPILGMATATARIFHSGQFSTLCRDAYLRGRRDPSVDPAYGHRLYDPAQVKVLRLEAGEVHTEAPFRQVTTMELDLSAAVERNNDTMWSLDLSQVLLHAVPRGFQAATRTQPFHWDFPQDDRITVIVETPNGMEVAVSGAEEGEWQCHSAMYRFRTERHPDGTWRMVSHLVVHDGIEPVSGGAELEQVLDQAISLGDLRLLLSLPAPRADGR